jgi:hypothetical protein
MKSVLYQHSIEQPKVADGGDDFELCGIVTNILNKLSRTANKRCSSSLRITHKNLTRCNP